MNYKESLDFLFSMLPAYHRIGKAAYKGDLLTTLELDEYFGHPHSAYRTVHIAGTNGKGSVSHMLASVLQEAGFRTGLYTSPHLRDFRERIRINGEMIDEESVAGFVERHKKIFEKLRPSFFEMSVAMAFDHFAERKVDLAVIEVGLGGRLDSTNIITPVLSVITNIGHDHMDLLGDTLPKVAAEKAGIIKRSVPLVVSETQKGIRDIFISAAREKDAEVVFADQKYQCILADNNYGEEERRFAVKDMAEGRLFEGSTDLRGDYQARNIPAVFCSAAMLGKGFGITESALLEGIRKAGRNTGLEGRWQIIGKEPLTVCDTAHNLEGLKYVLSQIKGLAGSQLHLVLGFVNDKDLDSILPLFPADATYYFTRASVPRALDERLLQMKAAFSGLKGEYYGNVRAALEAALRNADKNDVIFIGGSTFVVAEVV